MTAKPVLNQVNLVVTDMAATVAFYRRLGLTIPDTEPGWEAHHRSAGTAGDIDLDFDSVEFAHVWDEGWSVGSPGAVLSFHVDSRDAVDEIYEDLTAAGYSGEQGPYDTFWGARYAIVKDPDGNSVGIMSPIDPDLKSMRLPPG